ncbi:hypothetical protein GY45DRAFT_1114184 [Cubamyces sp. BRFM 1775]|nr:hypothetical protein GY45DRAFT_1114184 [Cubamyces sp. BRFM 1775]
MRFEEPFGSVAATGPPTTSSHRRSTLSCLGRTRSVLVATCTGLSWMMHAYPSSPLARVRWMSNPGARHAQPLADAKTAAGHRRTSIKSAGPTTMETQAPASLLRFRLHLALCKVR